MNFGDASIGATNAHFHQQSENQRSLLYDSLGMVRVCSYPRILDIHWDVQNVSRGALNAVLDHLISMESPGNNHVMVALRFFFGAWNSELFNSPGSAVERILEISEYAGVEPSEAITIAGVNIGAINSSHLLVQSCFERWHQMDGILGTGPTLGLGELSDRTIIMGPDALEERLVYKQVGTNSVACFVLGQDWRHTALELPADGCNSDNDYELEVVSDYPEVMSSGNPRLDHIRAFFQLEGEDPIWLSYERLLLPWKTRHGDPLIMCFSQWSQNLSVPFLEAAVDQAA